VRESINFLAAFVRLYPELVLYSGPVAQCFNGMWHHSNNEADITQKLKGNPIRYQWVNKRQLNRTASPSRIYIVSILLSTKVGGLLYFVLREPVRVLRGQQQEGPPRRCSQIACPLVIDGVRKLHAPL